MGWRVGVVGDRGRGGGLVGKPNELHQMLRTGISLGLTPRSPAVMDGVHVSVPLAFCAIT